TAGSRLRSNLTGSPPAKSLLTASVPLCRPRHQTWSVVPPGANRSRAVPARLLHSNWRLTIEKSSEDWNLFSRVAALFAVLLCGFLWPAEAAAYSVLSHEAIIDSTWDTNIKPLLLKRFPDTTKDELREAHGYAYGGAIIQDMGYYPHGSMFFSDLAHYVRSGDFVEILIRDSKDLNEYAFALGALAHYAAD